MRDDTPSPSPGKGWSKGREYVPRRVCETCGKRFYAPPALIRRGGGKFCSVACRGIAKRKPPAPPKQPKPLPFRPACLVCGARCKHKAAKYCSLGCRSRAYTGVGNPSYSGGRATVVTACQMCGITFDASAHDVDRGMGKFCSRDCYYAHQSTSGHEKFSRAAGGRRDDLDGRYFRSMWEANWARYLNWLVDQGEIVGWEYEVDTFEFHKIKRGQRFYTPDFKVTNRDGSIEYHEIKGWMDQPSRTKLDRMARYYPDVKVIVIDEKAYYSVAKTMKAFIPEWETKRQAKAA